MPALDEGVELVRGKHWQFAAGAGLDARDGAGRVSFPATRTGRRMSLQGRGRVKTRLHRNVEGLLTLGGVAIVAPEPIWRAVLARH
jgi:hypothetical protein